MLSLIGDSHGSKIPIFEEVQAFAKKVIQHRIFKAKPDICAKSLMTGL
jgi:hypothetical protein